MAFTRGSFSLLRRCKDKTGEGYVNSLEEIAPWVPKQVQRQVHSMCKFEEC